MTLKSKKRFFVLGTVGCLAGAGAVAVWGIEKPPLPQPEKIMQRKARPDTSAEPVGPATPTVADFQPLLAKPLRQPLYDPPPPPPPVVEKPPPQPLQARLLATMIEQTNSMAMLEVAGRVEFRKVGDVVSAANPDAQVTQIDSGSVVVSRGEETITLTVDGR